MNYFLKEVKVSDAINMLRTADTEQAFLPDADNPNFSVEKFLLSQEALSDFHLFVVTNSQGERPGFISLLPHKTRGTISVGPMYVLKQYRSRGIGKLMVQQIIAWVRENKFEKVFTKTWGQNKGSRRILESLKFKQTKETLGERVNGDSTVAYELLLEQPSK
ncbi:MAG: GNAT family N-acetyltransferase [Candidatus Roizmanbacteria bacterium]|nr:GNAT family N-acetyltransferase [Candidatus Roizmanbacteria bacterium]